jgi:hypothetical protein
MKLQTLVSATLLLALAPLPLAAQSTTIKTYAFEAVDSYDSDFGGDVSIIGIVQGEPTPRTLKLRSDISYSPALEILHSCERLSLLAMMKPGQYLLEVRVDSAYANLLMGCRLTRR